MQPNKTLYTKNFLNRRHENECLKDKFPSGFDRQSYAITNSNTRVRNSRFLHNLEKLNDDSREYLDIFHPKSMTNADAATSDECEKLADQFNSVAGLFFPDHPEHGNRILSKKTISKSNYNVSQVYIFICLFFCEFKDFHLSM